MGSGSLEKDSPGLNYIDVAEKQASLVHYHGRGKTTTSSAQNEPDAAVGCSSSAPRGRFLPSVAPLLYAASALDDRRIRCPEIRETVTSMIAAWDGLPQPLTRLCTSQEKRAE